MKRFQIIFMLFNICLGLGFSQTGQSVYTFLEMPFSSHMAAIGGANVSLRENDVSFALNNPALLSEQTDNLLSVNFIDYFADVSLGSAVYGKNWNGNYFASAIQYIDYGSFQGTSEINQSTGTFTAKDIALSLIYSKQLERNWFGGVCIKPVYSAYETYTSFAIGVDLGINYIVKDKGLSIGVALQNMGRQLTSYGDEKEYMPFNSMLGFSKKFSHAPFRVSVTAHHLHLWDLSYSNTLYITNLDGEKVYETISFVDMLFRHMIFGFDFIPSKNFYLSVGYNHQRAAELRLNDVKTIAGFSFGGGLKISKLNIGFSVAQYQQGIMTYNVSLNTYLDSFKKKSKKKNDQEDNSSN